MDMYLFLYKNKFHIEQNAMYDTLDFERATRKISNKISSY